MYGFLSFVCSSVLRNRSPRLQNSRIACSIATKSNVPDEDSVDSVMVVQLVWRFHEGAHSMPRSLHTEQQIQAGQSTRNERRYSVDGGLTMMCSAFSLTITFNGRPSVKDSRMKSRRTDSESPRAFVFLI